MAFYAGRIIRELAMANPTIVVLTDRNDLDDQLFGPSPDARIYCANPRHRRQAGRICAPSSLLTREVWLFTTHPEVLSRGEGRYPPGAFPAP